MTDNTIPLKSGETLVPKPGMWFSYREVTTKSAAVLNGKKFWWLLMTAQNGSQHLDTLSEDLLRAGWVRKPTFYKVGKKYKFPSDRDTVWTVLETYLNDPDDPNSKYVAIARKYEPSWDKKEIERLTENDFSRMVEV